MKFSVLIRSLAAAVALVGSAHAAVPLPSLNIDKTQITVSGLSSGGFMANQLGYAHSSTFKGVGVFAAGPYPCAGHSNYTACMYNATISSSALNTMQADLNNWSGTAIDAKSNVASQKVFLFVGLSDTTVGPNPMNAVRTQYLNNGVTAANLEYVQRSGTAHVLPTDFDAAGNNSCGSSASPYIANCGYDGAKAVLTKLYATIGDKFVRNTGFSRWADTNNIVVLFPQTKVDNTSRSTAASGLLPNPNGCWDWVGWYGSNFAQKAGTQIGAIKAMVDKVAGGTTGNPGDPGDPGDPGTPATCFTSSNYTHSISGRAYALYGITYANGSNQAMGLWNIFVTTTLKQTAPNYYVIGTCP